MPDTRLGTIESCQCKLCQSACERKPGWFAPDQIAALAKNLGLGVEELFKHHLSVDWWESSEFTDYKDVFVLSPSLKHEGAGDMFPEDPEGVCHWFVRGKCSIHERGKPRECANVIHGQARELQEEMRKEIVKAWIPQQQMIRDLLGREPRAAEWDGGGFDGLFSRIFG